MTFDPRRSVSMTGEPLATSYPENDIETYCEGKQSWVITSPQYPGSVHCIESRFMNDPSKGAMLPSPVVRAYMANVAKKVEEMADWGGSR